MSQDRARTVVSLKQNATLSAYRIVRLSGANQVGLYDTATSNIFGVTTDDGSDAGTNGAVSVCINGTTKVQLAGSVAAGSLSSRKADTISGLGTAITNPALITTTTSNRKALGIAMEAGSTNSIIEVSVGPVNNAILLT